MSNDSIDNMIENFVGSVRESSEAKNEGGLSGFTLKKTDEACAEFLRSKVLRGWKLAFPKAKKEPRAWAWTIFVKEYFEISRLGTKRFNKIVETANLEIVEDKLVLVEVEETPQDPGTSIEKSPTAVKTVEEEEIDLPPTQNPSDSKYGPETLECGHLNWYTEEEHEKAREEGHCCAGKKNKMPVDWSIRGLTHPVPKILRRGHAKYDRMPSYAWDGFCTCPCTGLYIGGIGNNCRHQPHGIRCVVHKRNSTKKVVSFMDVIDNGELNENATS